MPKKCNVVYGYPLGRKQKQYDLFGEFSLLNGCNTFNLFLFWR